ncbi:MAG: hypothetical protein ACFFAS_13065 [Promethearchaeota archaeon]
MEKIQIEKLDLPEECIYDKLEIYEKIKIDNILFKIPKKSCNNRF